MSYRAREIFEAIGKQTIFTGGIFSFRNEIFEADFL